MSGITIKCHLWERNVKILTPVQLCGFESAETCSAGRRLSIEEEQEKVAGENVAGKTSGELGVVAGIPSYPRCGWSCRRSIQWLIWLFNGADTMVETIEKKGSGSGTECRRRNCQLKFRKDPLHFFMGLETTTRIRVLTYTDDPG